jgi:hypothetical protein
MKLSRRPRALAALIALICMLFSQLAVAGYLCPSMQIAHAVETAAMAAMAEQHRQHQMDVCHSGDQAEPAPVCQEHGQTAVQSLDKPEVPNVSPFVARALVLTLEYDGPAPRIESPPPADLLLARTTAPPISIRNCCFRI